MVEGGRWPAAGLVLAKLAWWLSAAEGELLLTALLHLQTWEAEACKGRGGWCSATCEVLSQGLLEDLLCEPDYYPVSGGQASWLQAAGAYLRSPGPQLQDTSRPVL